MDIERFGELRSILASKQSQRNWFKLCQLLETWDDAPVFFLETVLPYTQEHLRVWPDEVREALGRWVDDAINGQPVPWLRVARRLRLSQGCSDDVMASFIQHPSLEDVWHLELAENSAKEAFAHSFASCTQLHSLRTLNLQFNQLVRMTLLEMIHAPAFASIRAFDVCGNQRHGSEIEAMAGLDLLDHPHCAQLQYLNYSDNICTPHMLKILVTSPNLQKLTHVQLDDVVGFRRLQQWYDCFESLKSMPQMARFETFSFSSQIFDARCQTLWAENPYTSASIREQNIRAPIYMKQGHEYIYEREDDYAHVP